MNAGRRMALNFANLIEEGRLLRAEVYTARQAVQVRVRCIRQTKQVRMCSGSKCEYD